MIDSTRLTQDPQRILSMLKVLVRFKELDDTGTSRLICNLVRPKFTNDRGRQNPAGPILGTEPRNG